MRHVIVGICGALFVAPIGAQSFFWNTSTFVAPPTAGLTYTLSYDTARARTVAVGTSGATVETWEYNGGAWTKVMVPGPSPDPMSAVYDSGTNHVLLVTSRQGVSTRLWQWDGASWSELVSTHTPPGRDSAAVSYDAVRGVVLLFGGVIGGVPLSDTWQWDGTDWVQRGSGGPPARSQAGMQFDPIAQRVVLFGGRGANQALYGDTWEWTGNNWVEHFGIAGPSARVPGGMTYDTLRNKVLMYGGLASGQTLTDLWEWNGASWTQRSVPVSPTFRGPITYDSGRDSVVLLATDGVTVQTWNYALFPLFAADFQRFGTGCLGTNGVPQLDATSRPIIGQVFNTTITNLPLGPLFAVFGLAGFSNTTWSSVALPLDLVILGMPGCLLRVSPDFIVPLAVGQSQVNWTLPMPADQTFVGIKFYLQALVLDPFANPFGATVSNGGAVTIGNN